VAYNGLTPAPDQSYLLPQLSPSIIRRLATHEAGHCVTWVALGGEIVWVDICERFCCCMGPTRGNLSSALILTSLAGEIAETVAAGWRIPHIWFEYDLRVALRAARADAQLPCDTCRAEYLMQLRRKSLGKRTLDYDLLREFRFRSWIVRSALSTPPMKAWTGRVADALVAHGALDDRMIRALRHGAVFPGAAIDKNLNLDGG
jgi:hypothetical protein